MTTDRLARVEALFHDALERPTTQRATFLAEACTGDETLRTEVLSLLESRSETFLNEALLQRPTELPALEPGARVGAYEISGVLGRGGMGTVYEARQSHPRRTVALKVMVRGRESTRAAQRFEDEAETLVRIDHPDIAHVYESGVDEGRLWLALELVEGAQDVLAFGATLDLRARLELLARIARVLHHGHLKGIVHCDVKPANLLVRPDGRPKLIDFGIARIAGEAADGLVAGTPGYMSPEQTAGAVADVRADVFALGVVLFQLVTGEPPERAGDPGPGLDRDLRAVVLKGLQPDANLRYQSARELATDLEHYLACEPVDARPAGRWHELQLFARRHTALVLSLAALVIVLVAGVVVSLRFALRADRARAEERVRSYAAMISAADSALRVRDVATARLRLEAAPVELRNWEWDYLHGRLDGSVFTFEDSPTTRATASVSPDGETLAIAYRHGSFSTIELRDTTTLELLEAGREVPQDALGFCLLDGGSLVTIDPGGRLTRFEPDGERSIDLVLESRAYDLVSRGSLLVIGNGDGLVRLHEVEDGTLRATIGRRAPTARNCFAVHPVSGVIVHAVDDELHVYGPERGELEPFPEQPGIVTAIAFTPDGGRMAVTRADGTVRVWDYAAREIAHRFGQRGAPPTSATFGPEGEWLAVGYSSGTLVLWKDGVVWRELWGHAGSVDKLQALPGRRLLSATWTEVKVWDLDRTEDAGLVAENDALFRDVDYSPDGRLLASTAFDGTTSVHRVDSFELVAEIQHAAGQVRGQTVAFSPDGRTVAVGWVTDVELWNPASGERTPLTPAEAGAFEAAWTRDGETLAVGGKTGVVLYDVSSAELLTTLPHPAWVRDIAITPDDERVLALTYPSDPSQLYVWHLDTHETLRIIELPYRSNCMALLPGGRVVATGSPGDRENDAIGPRVHLWDVETGRLLRTITGLTIDPWEMGISPDGSRLASVGANNTVRILDVEHGTQLLDLTGNTHWLWSVAWRPDGKQIAGGSGNYDGIGAEIRVWGD